MISPIDPTSAGFLLAENRNMPMHVGGLQLFKKPEDAGRNYTREMYEQMRDVEEIAPLFLKHPRRKLKTAGPAGVGERRGVRHRAPRPALGAARSPAGSASCSSCARGCTAPGWPGSARCGRPTSSRACATGGSRCTPRPTTPSSTASPRCACCRASSAPTPTSAGCPPRGATRRRPAKAARTREQAERSLSEVPIQALRTAMGITAEAAGMPSALIRTLNKGLRNETSALSLYAPRTIFNQKHHRLATVRRPGLADGAAARHRQGQRDDPQRRRAWPW